ncbi:MAG: efflux RND transporter periplasmic adaptor subunit, partial [Planctomycetota bacterium]
MKRFVVILVIIILPILGWLGWYWFAGNNNKITYRSAKVEKGNIIQTVNATGTIQPIKLVQVGTQVTGPITKLYVDYNSLVEENALIAQIDPAVYEARVAQDEANLIKSKAEVERVQANLIQAEKELVRANELAQQDLVAQSELDAAVATRDGLAAQFKIALASVEQNKSTLRMSEINLAYTTIKSPVNGTVISRKVNEGQTVV